MKPRRLTPEDLARVDRYLRNWEAEERVEFWLFCAAIGAVLFLCLVALGVL